ncbi:Signal recognition particle 68kDa [Fasciolopsis buskii]|uniref:Signal recognition particle subunit SRP68 n=1 Tax=Fasciolopsis buskii TaxID=27845 RepID=A0A8E0RP69_9TREM|nr:Signal recognition particle 68kDa [Fasciolopsis buski]
MRFLFLVLALVKSAQQQHGLRHGDYQRYHQYITRKLRRMRKSLHFQQGNRSKVIPKKLTPDLVTDPRFITLKVFEIERSWAYAMQLKTESNTELRKRFQMISRLRRAVFRGNQLSDLLNELTVLDAQTKLELRGYIQWIHGMLAFELQVSTFTKLPSKHFFLTECHVDEFA